MKRRVPVRKPSPEVLAALIQVMGLVLIALLITKSIERERLSQEHRLTVLREYEAQKYRGTEELIDLVNRACAQAQALVEVSGPGFVFAPGTITEEEARVVEGERDQVRRRFNDFVLEWRAGRFKASLLLKNYHVFQSDQVAAQDVSRSWRRLQEAVELYLQFAQRVYMEQRVDSSVHLERQDEVQFRLEELSRILLPNGDLLQTSNGG